MSAPECLRMSANLWVSQNLARISRGGCPRISRESRECPARANAPLVGVPECLSPNVPNVSLSGCPRMSRPPNVSLSGCPGFSGCPRIPPEFRAPRIPCPPNWVPNCLPASRVRNPFENQADFRHCQHSARTRHDFSDPMRGQQHEHAIPSTFREGHDEHKAPERFAQNSCRQGQRVADDGQPTEQKRPVAISLIAPLGTF